MGILEGAFDFDGATDGFADVEITEGRNVGILVGITLGTFVADHVGIIEGNLVGKIVECSEGIKVCKYVGKREGIIVGKIDGMRLVIVDGHIVGVKLVGLFVGVKDGTTLIKQVGRKLEGINVGVNDLIFEGIIVGSELEEQVGRLVGELVGIIDLTIDGNGVGFMVVGEFDGGMEGVVGENVDL